MVPPACTLHAISSLTSPTYSRDCSSLPHSYSCSASSLLSGCIACIVVLLLIVVLVPCCLFGPADRRSLLQVFITLPFACCGALLLFACNHWQHADLGCTLCQGHAGHR